VYGTGNTWPGLGEIAGPGFIQSTITLTQGRGNFAVPMQLLQSDKLDAAVGSAVAEIVKGAAKRAALANVHAFWKVASSSGGTPSIGTIAGVTGTNISATPATWTLTGGRIRNFFPGMFLDVQTDSSGVPDNTDDNDGTTAVVVTAVDYIQRKVTLRTLGVGGSASDVTLLTGSTYHLCPRDSSGMPNGLIDWVKSSGTVFGIALSSYPQFSSIVDSTLSGPLTTDILNKYIGGFEEAYGAELDTIIMTTGTLLAFLQNLDDTSQLLRYDVQGQALNVKAGFQGFSYTYGGRNLRILISQACPEGHVWVLKMGDGNIKKYVPPMLPKGKGDSRFGGEIEFVAPQMGSTSIFMPFYSSSNVTDNLQAPYHTWCQFAARMPQGIHLSTFATNLYAG
jgi:hypothetical protein